MKLENMKWPEVKKLAPRALASIAAVEQHGHHPPDLIAGKRGDFVAEFLKW